MKKLSILAALLLLVAAYTGCKKESTNQGVILRPKVILSSDTLIFHGNITLYLTISGQQGDTCSWQITSCPDWLHAYPSSGKLHNDIQKITLTSNFTSYNAGVYTGSLAFSSPCGNAATWIKGIAGENMIYKIPDSLKISEFTDTSHFNIINQGNVALNFSAVPSNNLITLDNASGTISIGGQQKVIVTAHRASLVSGTYPAMIFITINGYYKDTVNVSVRNFKENKLILQTDVIDAEYSKAKDILVFISTTPQSLNIYHPSTDLIESVSLSYVPTCISLSSDGNYAVVGHDAHLTYVNVTNRQVIMTCNVSCYAWDIVLGNNNWAYVFPKTDQWEHVRCINLQNGTEVLHKGYSIYAGTLAKMIPSGKYIYGADNGLSPDNLEKYDIRSDTLTYMYESPYWGDYPINGNLWFSEDGLRIFTQGRSVFRTSEIQSQDMIYNGMINFEGSSSAYNNIQGLDHSAAADNLYIEIGRAHV